MANMNIKQPGSFWQRFAPLFGAGAVGIAAIAPLVARQTSTLIGDKLASAPPLPVLIGAALIQTTVLVGVAVAAGVALAPRLGLRSHLVYYSRTWYNNSHATRDGGELHGCRGP